MTAAPAAGAASRDLLEWHAIDWRAAQQTVRRLQARIVKATQEGRWGKVAALQRLLTHSLSGKVLAVRRVTENHGKRTPGVDGDVWDTPAKKVAAIHRLRRRGYRPQPLRRVYIPKKNGQRRRRGAQMQDRLVGRRQLLALWKRQRGLCPVCTQPIDEVTGWHSHHVVPRSQGGSDEAANLHLLHPTCHQQLHHPVGTGVASRRATRRMRRLEPGVSKGASPVLRGDGHGNIAVLPD